MSCISVGNTSSYSYSSSFTNEKYFERNLQNKKEEQKKRRISARTFNEIK